MDSSLISLSLCVVTMHHYVKLQHELLPQAFREELEEILLKNLEPSSVVTTYKALKNLNLTLSDCVVSGYYLANHLLDLKKDFKSMDIDSLRIIFSINEQQYIRTDNQDTKCRNIRGHVIGKLILDTVNQVISEKFKFPSDKILAHAPSFSSVNMITALCKSFGMTLTNLPVGYVEDQSQSASE